MYSSFGAAIGGSSLYVATSQARRTPFHAIRVFPSVVKTRGNVCQPVSPSRGRTLPVVTSQRKRALSSLDAASVLPSGEKRRRRTGFSPPHSRRISSHEATSQRRISLSSPAAARILLSGEKATARTAPCQD